MITAGVDTDLRHVSECSGLTTHNGYHRGNCASASKRRLPAFAEAACDVPAAPGDETEQDRLEAVSVRHAPAVAAERMRLLLAFGQVAGNCLPDRFHNVGT
jgi:hypothetical protein